MIQKIVGEAPFQVLADNFSISPATASYTLQISADGINYSDLFTVAANTTRLVTDVANGSFYKLKNNTGEVVINWRSQCGGGDGGGDKGGGTDIPVVDVLPTTAEIGDLCLYKNQLFTYASSGTWGTYVGKLDEQSSECQHIFHFDYLPSAAEGIYLFETYHYSDGPFTVQVFSDHLSMWNSDGSQIGEDLAKNGGAYTFKPNDSYYGLTLEYTDEGIKTLLYTLYTLSIKNVADMSLDSPLWVKVSDENKADAANVEEGYGIPYWNKEGVIVGKQDNVYSTMLCFNTDKYVRCIHILNGYNNDMPLKIWVPTTAPAEGQILQGQGAENAPVWVDFTSLTNGISFWKGTQDEYNAITTKDDSTLYIITD